MKSGTARPKAGLKLCMVVTGFEAMHWMVVRRKKRALNTEGPFSVPMPARNWGSTGAFSGKFNL